MALNLEEGRVEGRRKIICSRSGQRTDFLVVWGREDKTTEGFQPC